MRLFFYYALTILSIISPQLLSAETSFNTLINAYNQELASFDNDSDNKKRFSIGFATLNKKFNSVTELEAKEITQLIELTALAQKMQKFEEGSQLLEKALLLTPQSSLERGFIYFQLGQFNKYLAKSVTALENFLMASIIFEKEKDYNGLVYAYLNISIINFESANNEIALDYAEQSKTNLQKSGVKNSKDSSTLSTLHSIDGILNRKLRNYDQALIEANKSIAILEVLGNATKLAIAKGNKAAIFYDMGEYDKAIPLLLNDYNISLGSKAMSSAFNAGITLCNIYLKQGKEVQLNELFDDLKAMKADTSIRLNNRQLLEYYELAADIYEYRRDDARSIASLKKYLTTKEIIDSVNRAHDIEKIKEKYLMEREVTKVKVLEKSNELQASNLKMRTSLLIVIAVVLLVVLFYAYVLRTKNKKIDKLNEMLEAKVSERTTKLLEINKELDNYLYRASHDIRRPIRTLLGLNNVMKFTDDPAELKMLFEKVYDTAMNMDEMLFKLQMAYELNNKHTIEKVIIKKVVDESIDDLKRHINYKNAIININISKKAESLKANFSLIKIAIDNVIENGLIYQGDGRIPEINISTDVGTYFFYIHIEDNGYGIDPMYQEQIFNAYFKISNKTQGSGLGLFLALRAITYLNGTIVVESVINEGTKFTIKIPLSPK